METEETRGAGVRSRHGGIVSEDMSIIIN